MEEQGLEAEEDDCAQEDEEGAGIAVLVTADTEDEEQNQGGGRGILGFVRFVEILEPREVRDG